MADRNISVYSNFDKFVADYLIKIGIFKDEMTLFSNASVLSCHNHVNDMGTCLIETTLFYYYQACLSEMLLTCE